MANVKKPKISTRQEIADVQQPLSRDGYSNDYFSKLYGSDKNPHVGTDRDRADKKNLAVGGGNPRKYIKGWEHIFKNGKNNKRAI